MEHYVPVRQQDPAFSIDDDDDDDHHNNEAGITTAEEKQHRRSMQPFQVEDNETQDGAGDHINGTSTTTGPPWYDPWWPLPIITTAFVVTPALLVIMWTFYHLLGRFWVTIVWVMHLVGAWSIMVYSVPCQTGQHSNNNSQRRYYFIIMGTAAGMEALLAYGYRVAILAFVDIFLAEPDGTVVLEYQRTALILTCAINVLLVAAVLRVWLGPIRWCLRWWCGTTTCRTARSRPCSPWMLLPSAILSEHTKALLWRYLHHGTRLGRLLAGLLLIWSILSLMSHVPPWPSQPPAWRHGGRWRSPQHLCDPLDATECWLPFPSFAHLTPDLTTATGYRVHLQTLPRLKGGMSMRPDFLNALDGFSTMAPMLFYMNGMKEAYEAGTLQLAGPQHIEQSVTASSITLLIDVSRRVLVPHAAEIDYLDDRRPLVLVFPAQPLQHAAHYAVAVYNATDVHGVPLPVTPGMQVLWPHVTRNGIMDDSPDPTRAQRYNRTVLPALQAAAPWVMKWTTSVQLLFDFVTISEPSQLGVMRTVRDTAIQVVRSDQWARHDHVRVVSVENNDCTHARYARTIHAELDVPWFLQRNGGRGATMSQPLWTASSASSWSPPLQAVKFVTHVPCSLRASALQLEHSQPLRAIVEYGHGLFGDRMESADGYLQQMAHAHGLVIVAMDWRGMSRFDLLVVVKTLMARPSLFEAVRDNLIQGYVARMVLQEFVHAAMLDMEWLQFRNDEGVLRNFDIAPAPNSNWNNPVRQVFYGNSQGGILGAGYTSLSAPLRRLDGVVLGVPGTPFALVMSRSLDFAGYDKVMLLNLYNNRQVRLLLSLVQMAWDTVEGAGVLAPPHHNDTMLLPPPILLQAGLGDAIVPTSAAEALARALHAHVLPHRVRDPYGIPVWNNNTNNGTMPGAILTEILFEREYASLPVTDTWGTPNRVHVCLRRDVVMMQQAAAFLVNGTVLDVCGESATSCVRTSVDC